MRDNNILCEYHDYIDKDLIIKILSPLGLDELKNKFIKNGIDRIKEINRDKDKDFIRIK